MSDGKTGVLLWQSDDWSSAMFTRECAGEYFFFRTFVFRACRGFNTFTLISFVITRVIRVPREHADANALTSNFSQLQQHAYLEASWNAKSYPES